MSRAKKLLPVVEMVRKATETELNKLGQTNALLQRDQNQLDDLMQYRAQYLTRFRQNEEAHMTAKQALELRGFLAQLDQAISAQQQQVNQSRQQVQYQQQNWLKARNKEQAIETLITKYQAEETLLQNRREQRDNDEHTNAMWVRKNK